MIGKKSRVLILFFLTLGKAFAGTGVYQPGWRHPDIKKEHGPFYSDSLVGLILQGGNTIDNTIAFTSTNSLVLESEMFQVGGHYTYGWDEDGLSSRNWDARARYERVLRKPLDVLTAFIIEGDPFAGFSQRTNWDIGASFPIQGQIFSWHLEAGYRYTQEKPTQEVERYQNKLRFHLGGEWKIDQKGTIHPWVRYLPFLSDTQGDLPNYMFDYGVFINSHFTESFYLNLNFIGAYRKVPLEDRKQNDYKLIGSIGLKI